MIDGSFSDMFFTKTKHFLFFFYFFFFQAEDGIRDWSVTGVQTCVLPIYCLGKVRHLTGHGDGSKVGPTVNGNGANGGGAIAQGQKPRSAAQLATDLENPHSLLSSRQQQIGHLALQEIESRLQFLMDVGLDYLTLDRPAATLSGGEAQRIRLATQIGAGLTGVLYVLDEPSIGLHQRDNDRLLNTLTKLRDLGNTLIVVEHDEDTIRAADYRSEEHTSELQSLTNIVCRLLLEKKKNNKKTTTKQRLIRDNTNAICIIKV